ncbi:ankyrin repeat-containing domain protein [Schizothecium vesticola]|uniref:Ankyrin repeat-containing domain protein n=1 Tax=Schizothecium vesticola TaxID=314040 RepID=A0AA40F2M6_9PEZI|nr:ankyrin repeat-containing domain protein [Schizothecium vesticola]
MLCPTCGRDFKGKRQLSQHVRCHNRKYRCTHEKCREKQGFAHRKDLLRHQQTHPEMKQIRLCHYCNRDIGREDNLGRHMSRAHKNKLSVAAASGDEAAVGLLLESGGDAKSKDIDINVALALASAKGHVNTVNILLDSGADIESLGNPAWTPLALTSQRWTRDEVMGGGLWSPLAIASRNGHEAVVRLLLERKASLGNGSTQYYPPLQAAAANGHTPIVRLLLDKGADVEAAEWYCRRTPLSHAAENGHEAVVTLLLNAGARPYGGQSRAKSALSLAARNGHAAVVKILQTAMNASG